MTHCSLSQFILCFAGNIYVQAAHNDKSQRGRCGHVVGPGGGPRGRRLPPAQEDPPPVQDANGKRSDDSTRHTLHESAPNV
jgi:hypothetical protein